MRIDGGRPLSLPRRDARLFCGPAARLLGFALTFPLGGKTRCLFSSTQAVRVSTAHLFDLEETLLLGSGARFFFASALRFLLDRNAGCLFGSMARFSCLALSVRLSCDAGLMIRPPETLLVRCKTQGLFVPSVDGHLLSARVHALGVVPALDLALPRPPQRTHHDNHDRRCERETEPTDEQKHLHVRGRSPLSCPATGVHSSSRPQRALSPVPQG
jgi:hypothetical protein